MTKTRSTKRALLLSMMSLILCTSMLIGTTYAWFTDSVSSVNNIITGGNLDVVLEWTTTPGDEKSWEEVGEGTNVFKEGALWEPGYTEVVYLKVKNAGSLAFKYQLSINVASEKIGKTEDGKDIKLSDYIVFDAIETVSPVSFADRAEARKEAASAVELTAGYATASKLYPEGKGVAEEYVTLVVYMPETVGNEANYAGDVVPEIKLGLNLFATQYTFEEDSFGNDYDYIAPPVYVSTQAELVEALNKGVGNKSVNIELVADVELTGEWTPIGDKDAGEYFMGTFDGAGHTVSGLSVTGGDYVALIGAAKDATIKNLTVEGTVAGENPAGIVARVEGATVITNCVNNANVSGSSKAGGIACNVTGTNPATVVIENCVNNGTVTGTATNGLGGMIGYINTNATVKIYNCVNNGAVTGTSSQYAGAVVGYAAASSAGLIVGYENNGVITGKNSVGDSLGRWLEAKDGTVLAAYCGTPANWDVSYEVTPETIESAFVTSDGTDITKKITNIVFGKPADYPDIVANYTATVSEGVSVYQVLNDDGNTYTVYYLSEDKISAPANSTYLFYEMSNMTKFDASNLDMSQVENTLCMFAGCTKLETIKGIEDWDMSNVTNMQSIFWGCNNLKDIDVSGWDTSNVTNMRMVFFRCYALSNDSLKGVENWDVSNVTNFYSMFKHARGLTSLDLSKWDTSSATNMSHMFANISGVEYLDLSGFDTSNVTDMSWMFYEALALKTVWVGDKWTTEAEVSGISPFYRDLELVGGSGTTWQDACDHAGKTTTKTDLGKQYAIVDGGASNPGLLTYKAN